MNKLMTFRNRLVMSSSTITASVLVLRVSFTLDVPVFESSDYVGLVSGSELDLHLVTTIGFSVLQKQIEPPRFGMEPFAIL